MRPIAEHDPGRAFVDLVTEVAEPVRRYLWRRTDSATADDVLSETLTVLWRRFGEVPEDRVAWAIGVARLQLQNAQRTRLRQDRVAARIIALDPPVATTQEAPDPGVDDAVQRVLALLPEADRELLRLSAWEELTPKQIGEVLGISANAASIRLHRARKRFAQRWQHEPHDRRARPVDTTSRTER